MSGRRPSSADGTPGAVSGSANAVSVPGRTVIADGGLPTKTPSAFTCWVN